MAAHFRPRRMRGQPPLAVAQSSGGHDRFAIKTSRRLCCPVSCKSDGIRRPIFQSKRIYNVDMKTNISRWGNSLAIRIPNAFAKELGLSEGSEVDLGQERGSLVVKPVQMSLTDMIKAINPENLHAEIETGPMLGREIW